MKIRIKLSLSLLLLMIFSSLSFAQITNQELPDDEEFRIGELDNGLKYYIRNANNGSQKVSFRIVVRGGAALEKKNEDGLCHFIEHMTIKGTKNFPEPTDVFRFWDRLGLIPGLTANAYTTKSQIFYVLNDVKNNVNHVDSCLLLLHDFTTNVKFDSAYIESERNVIFNEAIRNAEPDGRDLLIQELCRGSKYANRTVLGNMDVIRQFKHSTLTNLYKRLFQPQNMAIMVVGSIDVDSMENKIKTLFCDLERGNYVSKLPSYNPAKKGKIFIGKSYDDTRSKTHIIMRYPDYSYLKNETVADKGKHYQYQLINDIFEKKTQDIASNSLSTIQCISLHESFITGVPNSAIYHIIVDSRPNHWKQSLEETLIQIERFRRFGFDEKDWKKEKQFTFYNEDSTAINFSDTTYICNDFLFNSTHIDDCASNFLYGKKLVEKKHSNMVESFTNATLTPEDLHKTYIDLCNYDKMDFFVQVPDKTKKPTNKEVQAIIDRVRAMSDDDLAEQAKPKKSEPIDIDSIDINPVPGTIVKRTKRADSLTELILSNGVKVLHKKNNDRIYGIHFTRPSGFSVLSNEDIRYRNVLKPMYFKRCKGGNGHASCEPFSDNVTRFSNIESFEETMKEIFHILTRTEVDTVAFNEFVLQNVKAGADLGNPKVLEYYNKNYAHYDAPKRLFPISQDEAAEMNIEHFSTLVKEYKSNYNGSILYITGCEETDTIIPHIEKYIASLPSKADAVHIKEWPADHFLDRDTTVTMVQGNTLKKSRVVMRYDWEKGYEYTPSNKAHNSMLSFIIGALSFKTIRVENSDVYDIGCQHSEDILPLPKLQMVVAFIGATDNSKRICKDVQDLINEMAEGDLITQDLINDYITKMANSEPRKDGATEIINYELYGHPKNVDIIEELKKITPSSLKAYLKRILTEGHLHIYNEQH